MNWKEINDRYPQSFLEWVRVYMKDKYIKSAVVDNFTVKLVYEKSGFSYAQINRMDEEVYKLPYYFDKLGIFITADHTSLSDSNKFFVAVVVDSIYHEVEGIPYKKDRLSATIAGVNKAFEVREAQLNNN